MSKILKIGSLEVEIANKSKIDFLIKIGKFNDILPQISMIGEKIELVTTKTFRIAFIM